jgi:hypothetical protein
MTPFLKQVARYYLTVNDLEDYCFVFPNRRSGQFFSHRPGRGMLRLCWQACGWMMIIYRIVIRCEEGVVYDSRSQEQTSEDSGIL